MKKILFVCLGNICRSPMAEGMLKALSKGDYLVDSAATSTLQIGNAPHPGTQEVLSDLGITTEGMLARQITESDFYDFDFIIAMDDQNFIDLNKVAPKNTEHKIHMCIDRNVPDPYYTGDFDETKKLLSGAVQEWDKKVRI